MFRRQKMGLEFRKTVNLDMLIWESKYTGDGAMKVQGKHHLR